MRGEYVQALQEALETYVNYTKEYPLPEELVEGDAFAGGGPMAAALFAQHYSTKFDICAEILRDLAAGVAHASWPVEVRRELDDEDKPALIMFDPQAETYQMLQAAADFVQTVATWCCDVIAAL